MASLALSSAARVIGDLSQGRSEHQPYVVHGRVVVDNGRSGYGTAGRITLLQKVADDRIEEEALSASWNAVASDDSPSWLGHLLLHGESMHKPGDDAPPAAICNVRAPLKTIDSSEKLQQLLLLSEVCSYSLPDLALR